VGNDKLTLRAYDLHYSGSAPVEVLRLWLPVGARVLRVQEGVPSAGGPSFFVWAQIDPCSTEDELRFVALVEDDMHQDAVATLRRWEFSQSVASRSGRSLYAWITRPSDERRQRTEDAA